MIELAVILAAGTGSRLNERTKNMPKSFIQIGDSTLIERSIKLLKDFGIKRVVIGIGHESEWFKKISVEGIQIHLMQNLDYAQSGSLETWSRLRNYIHEDFLLLESDLLYERNALVTLITGHHKNSILASGCTGSGDEVWIETNTQHKLIAMNKDRSLLKKVDAELVGINKISHSMYVNICSWADALTSPTKLHYEDALVYMAKRKMIHVECVKDLIWTEIDNEEHLDRAVNIIWPKIEAKDIA